MITKIAIPQEVVNKIQALNAEVDARKNLIAFMISSEMNISNEQFNNYQSEYLKYFVEFEEAKSNFEKEYVRTAIANPISWNLDYQECEVAITHA